jgi:phosphate transport system substrate-binding protein
VIYLSPWMGMGAKQALACWWVMLATWAVLLPTAAVGAMQAEKFSDPNLTAKVPQSWVEQPVKHEDRYADADLVLALGQQTYPVFREFIEDYAKQNHLNIVIQPGTCGISAGKLLRKSVDLAAFCCPPARTDRFPGTRFHSLGIAPIALIVHPDNPVNSVTLEEARQIYQGSAPTWSDVKPRVPSILERPIQPVGRLHCKIRPGHWRALLPTEEKFSAKLYEVGVIPDMISQVARNPAAIGWETPLMVRHYSAKGKVKMLNIDNMDPTDTRHALAGDWPFYRTYHLVTWAHDSKTNREATKLVAYLRNKIEAIHQEIGFVPPSKLKQAGWRFLGDELVAEPGPR